ncbi:MAG: haloacid dehalogenase type II [Pseudomonadota bacterium]
MSVPPFDPGAVDALAFDVFGTVVDWRSGVIREARRLSRGKGIRIDWGAFADAWRGKYAPSMDRVRRGEQPWTKIDDLQRASLDELMEEFGIGLRFSDGERDELNLAWHRLPPWKDSVAGLRRLKKRYILGTLSNGNVRLLVDMARNARLPWDVIFSAETFRHFKRDPETYLGACDMLSLPPVRVMMVAAHQDDLLAAHALGLRTAFVRRPLEFGDPAKKNLSTDPRFDLVVDGLDDLAAKLGC